MASSLALKRIASSSCSIFNPNRYISVTRFAPSVSRSFNTNAQMTSFEDDRTADVDRGADRSIFRRRGRDFGFPSVFSDVFDPFSSTRSLSQILNLMDQISENPFLAASQGIGGGRSWDVKEDNEALHLRMDMPGVSKDDVQVSVEQNTLVIKGEGEKESEDGEGSRRYSSRIDLPLKTYKLDDIKAEMKNGVLKVVVPKVKEEERKNVFQVNVE